MDQTAIEYLKERAATTAERTRTLDEMLSRRRTEKAACEKDNGDQLKAAIALISKIHSLEGRIALGELDEIPGGDNP